MFELTAFNTSLIAGISALWIFLVWLVWLVMVSYKENTVAMTRVADVLAQVDRKLDTAADRDLEVVKTLAAIHAQRTIWAPEGKVVKILDGL